MSVCIKITFFLFSEAMVYDKIHEEKLDTQPLCNTMFCVIEGAKFIEGYKLYKNVQFDLSILTVTV